MCDIVKRNSQDQSPNYFKVNKCMYNLFMQMI